MCCICSTDIAIYSSHGWVNDILSDKLLIYKQDFSAISFMSIYTASLPNRLYYYSIELFTIYCTQITMDPCFWFHKFTIVTLAFIFKFCRAHMHGLPCIMCKKKK